MTEFVVACDTRDSATVCAQLMREKGVDTLVVLGNGRLAGILTDGLLVREVVAEGLDPDQVQANDIMIANPATVTLDDNLFSVVDTLRSAGVVRSVPVVNSFNEVMGIVSIADLAVIARDLIDAVLLEETHRAQNEARLLTGGQRMIREMRRPSPNKLSRMPSRPRPRPHRRAMEVGPATKTGTGGLGRGGGEGRGYWVDRSRGEKRSRGFEAYPEEDVRQRPIGRPDYPTMRPRRAGGAPKRSPRAGSRAVRRGRTATGSSSTRGSSARTTPRRGRRQATEEPGRDPRRRTGRTPTGATPPQ